MIKAIIFDFQGVLAIKKPGYQYSQTAREVNQEIGKVTDDAAFKSLIMKRYGFSEEEFQKVLLEIVNKYEPYKKLWKLLPELRKKYKLAIINNGTYFTVPEFKKSFSIDDNFDLFVSSAIEGVRKPDKEIFLRTAQKLGVKPEECLFMDDSEGHVEGARAVGLQVIHWENEEEGFNKLIKYLNKLEGDQQ